MKKLKLILFSFFVLIIFLEVFSFSFFKQITGEPFDYSFLLDNKLRQVVKLQRELNPSSFKSNSFVKSNAFELNPYLGYDDVYGIEKLNKLVSVKKESSDFYIGIMGGSVAQNFANSSSLINQLKQDVNFKNKQIKLIPLCVGGFKQPQPLIKFITYYLSNVELDMVINIDGFNELVMGVENIKNNINPYYPSINHTEFIHEILKQKVNPITYLTRAKVYENKKMNWQH